MKNYFLIHGSFGNSQENWFPWLIQKLKKKNERNKIIVPNFPTPEKQNYKNWEKILLKYKFFLNKDTIFIAHSTGCAFVLDFLIKNKIKIKGVVFVSGFYNFISGNQIYDILNEPFYFNDLVSSF